MKNLIKKNLFYFVAGGVLVINSLFLLYIYRFSSQANQSSVKDASISAGFTSELGEENRMYGRRCPDIMLESTMGNMFNLSDYKGNVIVIRFTRFFKRDVANLIYLEHLEDKFKDEGLNLFFINSTGKFYEDAISQLCEFSSPIIEGNSALMAKLNAGFEHIMVVARDFNIRFSSPVTPIQNKFLLFNEVTRWIFEDKQEPKIVPDEELESMFRQVPFHNVFVGQTQVIGNGAIDKNIILTLFTSTCTGCEETSRISVLKDLSQSIDQERTQIVILFSSKNRLKAIKRYGLLNGWDNLAITTGVIKKNEVTININKLFHLSVDPRTFIINRRGKLVFSESLKNTKKINLAFLLNKL